MSKPGFMGFIIIAVITVLPVGAQVTGTAQTQQAYFIQFNRASGDLVSIEEREGVSLEPRVGDVQLVVSVVLLIKLDGTTIPYPSAMTLLGDNTTIEMSIPKSARPQESLGILLVGASRDPVFVPRHSIAERLRENAPGKIPEAPIESQEMCPLQPVMEESSTGGGTKTCVALETMDGPLDDKVCFMCWQCWTIGRTEFCAEPTTECMSTSCSHVSVVLGDRG